MAFTVYRSSAGSGKTYTLVREYLSLVLKSPGQFRRILAITFTNKAANEMKARIIQVLRKISMYDPEKPDPSIAELIQEIREDSGLDEKTLVRNAGIVLSEILHHYSDFAVRTIDSFVHRILKNFAFDLNLPQNFDVETDTDNIYTQVIDLLISRAGTEDLLTRFLVEFVRTRAEEEKNWQIESELLGIAHWLNMEDTAEKLRKNAHLELSDYVRIDKDLRSFNRNFENSIRGWASEAIDIIDSVGIPYGAFSHGQRGLPGYFKALSEEKYDRIPPSPTLNRVMEEQKWYSTSAKEDDCGAIDSIKEDLMVRWERIQQLREEQYNLYLLYGEIRKNLYPLAILDEINQMLTEFKSENNLLLISEFNQRIAEIVLDEPVPFIYERAGEKFNHFLIDEFQDTSVLQWQNLLPLVENALASGFKTMVVGDAKQAIYRWRNSEVEQFVRLPEIFDRREGSVHLLREKMLKDQYTSRALGNNYRSCPEIVQFNNAFFNYVKGFLSGQEAVIYEDLDQEAVAGRIGGQVQITFYPDNEEQDFEHFNYEHVRRILNDIRARGYPLRDVAMLCRNNDEGGKLAEYLLENNIPVVSSESIRLVASPNVRLVVALLRLLTDQNDLLAGTEAIHLLCRLNLLKEDLHFYLQKLKPLKKAKNEARDPFFTVLKNQGIDLQPGKLRSLPVYDLVEELIRILNFDGKTDPFMQFFLDLVLDQARGSASSVARFLEHWELKKSGLSIVVPEGLNAVRIMTIHKAKGLEFPVVVCPFVRESLRATNKKMWIDLDEDPVAKLNAALVNINKNMEETSFGERIQREHEKSLLDMINLLYVALTRPTDYLYILSDQPKPNHRPPKTIPSLLSGYLKKVGMWQENQSEYTFGSPPERTSEAKENQLNTHSVSLISYPWRNRILLSYQAPMNWTVEEPEQKQEWGNLIHRILSWIETPEDLDPVLEEFLHQGIIEDKEFKTLSGLIREFLERPEVAIYFKQGLKVLTESEIITSSGKILRPDRILLKKNETIVIDFKTGGPSGTHRTQMKTYLDVLRKMDYPQVKGLVLYLNPIAPVELK